ncbi:collectin-12 [Plakobranchus ocellatus]|uniref:Collectin-12 n=1 Tax=Plakobranchus ocellatus TaxID=259542 RepID=A0AAV4CM89_9GAST|nr:collectin-12 [Plakobranchus ocellatus]
MAQGLCIGIETGSPERSGGSLIASHSDITFWIGLQRIAPSSWSWLDEKTKTGYSNWENSFGDRPYKCAALVNDGKWKSKPCIYGRYYICQKSIKKDCPFRGTIYPHMTQRKFPQLCGNPFNCLYRRWVRQNYECSWKGHCLKLNEARDGNKCIKGMYNLTVLVPE